MSLVVTFISEATRASGLGHLSRCLAFAEALEECGGKCRFLGKFDGEAQSILDGTSFPYTICSSGSGAGVEDAIGLLREQQTDATVVDSYGLDDEDLSEIHAVARPLLLIDDFANLRSYPCDAILNFTVSAPRLEYPASVAVQLLGTGYFLARRALRIVRLAGARRPNKVRNALVAIGGVDRHDLTRSCLQALLKTGIELEIGAVIAPDSPHRQSLAALLQRFHPPGRMIVRAATLADELTRADVCISGGGLTKYEAAYLGVPTAVLSQTTEQAEETIEFARAGLAVDLGLGPEIEDRLLVLKLRSFLQDSDNLLRLHETCMGSFPLDPTARAARELGHLAESAAQA